VGEGVTFDLYHTYEDSPMAHNVPGAKESCWEQIPLNTWTLIYKCECIILLLCGAFDFFHTGIIIQRYLLQLIRKRIVNM